MSGIYKEGSFISVFPEYPGNAVSVRILEPVVSKETDQHLLEIFRGEGTGLVLALDGAIRVTENSEYLFHEMFAHCAAFCHEEPERVLVIGDPTGGVVRELLKHPYIEQIDFCAPDPGLTEQCIRYIPWTKAALSDSRVEVLEESGEITAAGTSKTYDLILADLPMKKEFPAIFKRALKPDGIFSMRVCSPVIHVQNAFKAFQSVKNSFEYAELALIPSPALPYAFIQAGSHPFSEPIRRPIGLFTKKLKIYSAATHKAAFTHLPFWDRMLRSDDLDE